MGRLETGDGMKLKGKVAIVTGAGRSIGQAIATLFAREGAAVVIAEIDGDRAIEVAREIEAAGGTALALPTDISRVDSVEAMAEETMDRFGTIDILVNNAAISGKAVGLNAFLTLDVDHDWKRIIDTNLTGTFICSKVVAGQMAEIGKGGVILNVSSVSGSCPTLGCTPYGVSKAGVNMLTRTLAGELANHSIRVNGIAPGPIVSESSIVPGHLEPDPAKTNLLTGRWGNLDDISRAALFFVSDDASFITGQILGVDGGVSTSFRWLAYRKSDQ